MGVHVGGETHLERDLPLDHVFEQRGVFPQSSTVADPLGAALMERLVDGLRAIPFPGVAGARHAVLRRVLERGRVVARGKPPLGARQVERDRKSTRLNSSHSQISYAVFCLKKKK